MKGIASTGAPKIHVPGWMDGWMDGWMGGWVGGCKSRFKDCLQQSKTWTGKLYGQIFLNREWLEGENKNYQGNVKNISILQC
jgi:hypothetical protein